MWGGRLCGFLVLCWSIAQCYGQEQRRKRRIGIGVITECFEKTTYPFGLNTAFRDFNHTKYNGTAFEFVVANLRHNSCKDEEGNDPLEAAGVLLAMFSKGVSAVIGLVGSAVAVHLVPLANSLNIPFLSTEATLSELEKNFSPVFWRVGVPSDRGEAAAITKVLEHFDWQDSRKALVFSGNVDSRGLANEIETAGGQGYTRILLPETELRGDEGAVDGGSSEFDSFKERATRLRSELMKVNGWRSDGAASTDDVAIFLFLAVMEDARLLLEAAKAGNKAKKGGGLCYADTIGEIPFNDDWPGLLDRPDVAVILNDDLAANLRTGRHRMKLLSDAPEVLRGMLGVTPPGVSNMSPERFGIPKARLELEGVGTVKMNELTPRVYDLTLLVMTVLAEASKIKDEGHFQYSLSSFKPRLHLITEPLNSSSDMPSDIRLRNLTEGGGAMFDDPIKPSIFQRLMKGGEGADGFRAYDLLSLDKEPILKNRTDFALLNFRFEGKSFNKTQLATIQGDRGLSNPIEPTFGGSDNNTIPPKDCIVCGQQCPACGADGGMVEEVIRELMADCRNCKLALSVWNSMEPQEREGWGKIPLWMRHCIDKGFDIRYLEDVCPGSMTLSSAPSEAQRRFVQMADLTEAVKQGDSLRSDRLHFCYSWEALKCLSPSDHSLEGGYALHLSTIGLFGPLPQSLWRLKYAQTIDLSRNNLDGPLFKEYPNPPKPRFLSSCNKLARDERLRVLRLRGNRLQGSLQGLRGVTGNGLRELDVSRNLFSGPIPEDLLTFPNISEGLDFESNRFNHPIPDPSMMLLEKCVPNPHLARLSFGEAFSTEDQGVAAESGNLPVNLVNHHIASIRVLRLGSAGLGGDGLERLNFTRAASLQDLDLRGNPFTPGLPNRLMTKMLEFCKVSGNMPVSLDARQWGCAPGTRPPIFREKASKKGGASDDLCSVLLKKSWRCSVNDEDCTYEEELPSCAMCAPCDLGETTEGSGGVCSACPAGKMSNVNFTQLLMESTECRVTPKGGAFVVKGVELTEVPCRVCGHGFFSPSDGSCTCTPCFPGTFSDDSGSSSCRTCPPGTFADGFASDSCKPCLESALCGPTEAERLEAQRNITSMEIASWGTQSDVLQERLAGFNASATDAYKYGAWAGLAKLRESQYKHLRSICPSPREGFHAVAVRDNEGVSSSAAERGGPVSLCACVYDWLRYDGLGRDEDFFEAALKEIEEQKDREEIGERGEIRGCNRFFQSLKKSRSQTHAPIVEGTCPAAQVCEGYSQNSLCHLALEESTSPLQVGQEEMGFLCGAEDRNPRDWGDSTDLSLSDLLAGRGLQVQCQHRDFLHSQSLSTNMQVTQNMMGSGEPSAQATAAVSRGESGGGVSGAFFWRCPWGDTVCGVDNECLLKTTGPYCSRCEEGYTRSALSSGCQSCDKERGWLIAKLILILIFLVLVTSRVVKCILTGRGRIKTAERSMQAAVFKILTTWFELFIVSMKLMLDSVAHYRSLLEKNGPFLHGFVSSISLSGGVPIHQVFDSPVTFTFGLDCIPELKTALGTDRPEQIHLMVALMFPLMALAIAFSVAVLAQLCCRRNSERRRAGLNRLLLSREGAMSAGSLSGKESRGRGATRDGEGGRRTVSTGSSLSADGRGSERGRSRSPVPPPMKSESEDPIDFDQTSADLDIETGGRGWNDQRANTSHSLPGGGSVTLSRAWTGPIAKPAQKANDAVPNFRRSETVGEATLMSQNSDLLCNSIQSGRSGKNLSFWRTLFRSKAKRGGDSVTGSNQPSEAASSVSGTEGRTQKASPWARWRSRVMNRCLSSWVVVLFLSHPCLAREFSRNVSCVHVNRGNTFDNGDGKGRPLFLAMDPNLSCHHGPHQKWYILAWIGLFVWTIGTLTGFAIILRSIRFRLHEDRVLTRFGFLYRHYKPRLFAWELWAMSRKILVLLPLWIPMVPSLRTTLWLVIAVVFLWVHALAQPYSTSCFSICNRLEQHALMAFFVTILGAQVIGQLGVGVEDLLEQGRNLPGIIVSLNCIAIFVIAVLSVHVGFFLRVILVLCRPILRQLASASRLRKKFHCGKWMTSGWKRYRKSRRSGWARPLIGFGVEAETNNAESENGDRKHAQEPVKKTRSLHARARLLWGFRWSTDDVDAPAQCSCLNRRGPRRVSMSSWFGACMEKKLRVVRVTLYLLLLAVEVLFESSCSLCGFCLCWSRKGWRLWGWARSLLLLQQNPVVLREGRKVDTQHLSRKEREYAADLVCDVVKSQLQMLGGEVDLQITNELFSVPLRKCIMKKLRSHAKAHFYKCTVLSGVDAWDLAVLRHRLDVLERRQLWAELVRVCRVEARRDQMTQMRLRDLLERREPIETFLQSFGHLLSARSRTRRRLFATSTTSSFAPSLPLGFSTASIPSMKGGLFKTASGTSVISSSSTLQVGRGAEVPVPLRGGRLQQRPSLSSSQLFSADAVGEGEEAQPGAPPHSSTDPHPLKDLYVSSMQDTRAHTPAQQSPHATAQERADAEHTCDGSALFSGLSLHKSSGELALPPGKRSSRKPSLMSTTHSVGPFMQSEAFDPRVAPGALVPSSSLMRYNSCLSSLPSSLFDSASFVGEGSGEMRDLQHTEKMLPRRQRALYAACVRVRALVRFVRAVTQLAKDARKPPDPDEAAEICRMTVEDLQAELSAHRIAEQVQVVKALREHPAECVGVSSLGGNRPEKFLPSVAVGSVAEKGDDLEVKEAPVTRYDLLWKWREFRASTILVRGDLGPRSPDPPPCPKPRKAITRPSLVITLCEPLPASGGGTSSPETPAGKVSVKESGGTPSPLNLCAESPVPATRGPSGSSDRLLDTPPGGMLQDPSSEKSTEKCIGAKRRVDDFECLLKSPGSGTGPRGRKQAESGSGRSRRSQSDEPAGRDAVAESPPGGDSDFLETVPLAGLSHESSSKPSATLPSSSGRRPSGVPPVPLSNAPRHSGQMNTGKRWNHREGAQQSQDEGGAAGGAEDSVPVEGPRRVPSSFSAPSSSSRSRPESPPSNEEESQGAVALSARNSISPPTQGSPDAENDDVYYLRQLTPPAESPSASQEGSQEAAASLPAQLRE